VTLDTGPVVAYYGGMKIQSPTEPVTLKIRVTRQLQHNATLQAKTEGMSLSAWVRRLMTLALRNPKS
jgi:predicted HicB family RNase H-like nuclease